MSKNVNAIDLVNALRSQIQLLLMAASAIEDLEDRAALQAGADAALETLKAVKASLSAEADE